jgi:RNA polymerase sigma factor (TIGR02999 family)
MTSSAESRETRPPATGLTELLQDSSRSRREIMDALLPRVYEELRSIAQARMAGERREHTLQATALVNEAYLRLVGDSGLSWSDRAQFYHAAAEAMRRILIEHARKRGREKRGGDRKRLPVSVLDLAAAGDSGGILAVEEAIRRLEAEDNEAGAVVRLRFFAGLSVEETARALDLSPRSVAREWAYARARLFQFLKEAGL